MPFREIVGHRALVDVLARAVARETLPPSLLFCGPHGVGKYRVAKALAQVLNCEQPVKLALSAESADPVTTSKTRRSRRIEARAERDEAARSGLDACGTCGPCRRIERGVHADVVTVAPGDSGVIKVDAVRAVVEQTRYRPFEGRRRVVIVDEADAMVDEAQNALLKILEEPPSSAVFVLVTARAEALRPTVRSRCPRLRFGPLSPADIVRVLRTRGLSEPAARAAAAVAGGRVGRALALQEGDLAEARDTARRILHLAATTTDVRRRLEAARALVGPDADRGRLIERLQVLAGLVRDVGLLSTGAEPRLLANADLATALKRVAAAFGPKRVIRAFTAIDRALVALEQRNGSPKIVADWLLCCL